KDSSDQGKDFRCPKCQAIFQLHLPDRVEPTDGSAPAVIRSRPSLHRRGPAWLTIALVLAVVGVAGAVAGLLYKASPTSVTKTLDLTYLPQETDVVACLKVGELLRSPLLTDVLANSSVKTILTLVSSQSGVALQQIESVTLGVVVKQSSTGPITTTLLPPILPSKSPQPYGVLVVRSTIPLDAEAIAVKSLKGTAQTHAGVTYFKLPVPANQGFDSLFFPEPEIAVLALEANLKAVIDQGSKPAKIPEFDFVKTDQTFVVALTSSAIDTNPTHPPVTFGPNLQLLEAEFKQNLRTASLGLIVSDQIDLELIVNCANEPGATRLRLALETNVIDLESFVKLQQSWLNLSGLKDVGDLAEETVNSIITLQSNRQLQVTASVSDELKKIIAKYLAAFAPSLPGGMALPTLPAGLPIPIPGLPGFFHFSTQ
ncbi:MAG: hypothetical protein JWM11_1186, partial [Planctomycetaceae bacterium]|nr:hypothetical protein [Planctomycetaceae bacterium]